MCSLAGSSAERLSPGCSLERLKISRSEIAKLVAARGLLGVNVSKPNGTRKVQGPEGADPILDPQEIQLFPMFTTRIPAAPHRDRFAFRSPIVLYSRKQ